MTATSTITFGEVLRRLRVAAGLTQDELAQRANLSLRAISDLERGARNRPWRDTIQRLTVALDLEPVERDQLAAAARPAGTPFFARVGVDETLPEFPLTRHNLPAPLTSFIGRECETVELKELLASTRLLTLTGIGGIGKTRLALQVARDVLDSYPDGAWLVDLAPLADADLLPSAIASALAIRDEAGQPTLSALLSALRSRQVLLVLDNCEHLIEACAELTRTLLQSCPDVTILATSRERLGSPGEFTWRVPSLATVSIDNLPSVEAPREYEAVRLFVERARAVEVRFDLTPQNAAAVAEICRRLDGIPLAIELAAAWVRVLTPAQIADRLDNRFALLIGNDRAGTPRHATLRAAIDWSHDLLDEGERILFRRLAVFAGGWSLEGAEAVCTQNGIVTSEVLDRLTSLVDKSLVIVEDDPVQTRYRSPETIREYSLDRLTASGEGQATRDSHAAYCLALADAGGLAQLDRERDNVRAALRWFEERGDVTAGVRVVRAMCEWWHQNGPLAEGKAWLERFRRLPNFASASLEVRARALMAEIHLDTRQDPVATRASSEKLNALGREVENPEWQEFALAHLSWSSLELGELSRAEGELTQHLAVARQLGVPTSVAFALILLGDLARLRGEDDLARAHYQDSQDTSKENEAAWKLRCLGFVAVHRGELGEAESLFRDSLAIATTMPNTLDKIECLGAFASLAAARGEAIRAAHLLGVVDAALEMIGLKLYFGDRFERARTLDALGASLSEANFAAAAAEGQAMTLEQAISYALDGHRPT